MIHSNGPTPTTIDSCGVVELFFDRVEQIVDDREPHDVAIGTAAARGFGVDAEALDRVVSILALQLWHALGLTESDEDRRDLAIATVEEASSLRRASQAALGAIISMVEAIVHDETESTGDLALIAVDQIDAVDLFEAAVSVSAAITWNVADRLALDQMDVMDVMDVVRESRAEWSDDDAGSSTCASRRGRLSRRDGQTWSGRNSQCHGSRGTASTHPNLGPLVFNH